MWYTTNENLTAIVAGLRPTSDHNVLAIAGSGDQAFALLESGCAVAAIDNNPAQLELVQHRIDLLQKGNYADFRGEGAGGRNRERRNLYFSDERIQRIHDNISKLTLVDGDLLDLPIRWRFDAIYCSNALGFAGRSHRIEEKIESLVPALNQAGHLYVATGGELAYTPPGFEVARSRTRDAQRSEVIWYPTVLTRK